MSHGGWRRSVEGAGFATSSWQSTDPLSFAIHSDWISSKAGGTSAQVATSQSSRKLGSCHIVYGSACRSQSTKTWKDEVSVLRGANSCGGSYHYRHLCINIRRRTLNYKRDANDSGAAALFLGRDGNQGIGGRTFAHFAPAAPDPTQLPLAARCFLRMASATTISAFTTSVSELYSTTSATISRNLTLASISSVTAMLSAQSAVHVAIWLFSLLALAAAVSYKMPRRPTGSLGQWLERKRYQYEVTFSLYMLTPTEKFIFSAYTCPHESVHLHPLAAVRRAEMVAHYSS